MRKRTLILVLFAALLTLHAANAQAPKPAPAAQAPKAEPQEPIPSLAIIPPGYKFDPQGRRDPFVNPVPKPPKAEPEIPAVRPPGLKGVLYSEATVSGVIWSDKVPDMVRAIISAPGNKTYPAKIGAALFDATIKEIQKDGVVFELKARDAAGKPTTREVTRKVRPTP